VEKRREERGSRRGLLLVVVPVIVSAVVVGALAVPLISVAVQQLGAGYSEVLSPVGKAWVNHVFAVVHGRIVLDKVRVKFDRDLPQGAYIRVELRDSNDRVLASGEVTLQQPLLAGQWLVIDLSPDLGIQKILRYSRVVVLVSGPEVTT